MFVFTNCLLFIHLLENSIDSKGILSALTLPLIKELIPEIGIRVKFIEKWEQLFGDKSLNKEEDKTLCDTDSISDESDEENTASNCQQLERTKSFVGNDMYRRLTQPKVKTILQNSHSGRTIIQSYKKSKTLSRQNRNILVDIIITHIIDHVHGKLNKHDFHILAKDIIELFPSEDINLYYVPPISKSKSKYEKSVSVRGKLADKYRNKIRMYKRLSTNFTSTNNNDSDDNILSNDIKDSITWLGKHQAPWESVISHWEVTRATRISEWQKNKDKHIFDIIDKWPILRNPMGFMLIEKDFDYLELTKEVNSIENWYSFFERIHAVCPTNKKKIQRVENLNDLLQQEIGDDSKIAVQLSLLAYMIPPKGRICTRKKHFKPSMAECEESIIVHVTIAGDVTRVREEKARAMQQLGLTVQPYIIVVGPSLKDIYTTFVCVDTILYTVPTVLKAIDICFKTFHTFDANYPSQSEHIWYLIQLELYKFTTRYDKKISYILEIISALKNNA
ncbi:uncharacterized protein [Prorops nasuta]|uniref:uncharacterized protein n=1 Tax=Prorops nasuta TaxID=863751 RepID=UPI0034CE501B